MSKIKEAVELLEKEADFDPDDRPESEELLSRLAATIDQALALLRPLAEEPLQGLRDDVQAVLKKLPHARCHNLEIPEGCGGQCQGADEECAKCLLQSALIKHRAEEPSMELKLCPFLPCVGKGKIQQNEDIYYVYCENCGRHTDSFIKATEAVIRWNTMRRAEEPEVGEVSNGLRVIATQMPYWRLGGFDAKKTAGFLIDSAKLIDNQAQTIKDQAAEIKDVIKFKDGIIKALNKRLSDLGAQC